MKLNDDDAFAQSAYIVTGSNGEIGSAICRRLLKNGHRVFAVTRKEHQFEGIEDAQIENLVIPQLDDEIAVNALFEKLEAEKIDINGLVYGAAIFNRFESLSSISGSDWLQILSVNVVGAFFWARRFAQHCKTQDHVGSIVNISSQAAFTGGYGGVVPYAASKGALTSMTKGLAREFASSGIRINCVAPGFIDTKSMKGNLDTHRLQQFLNRVPMDRLGRVEEVAAVVAFLLSHESSYMTGTTVDTTGGQLMH